MKYIIDINITNINSNIKLYNVLLMMQNSSAGFMSYNTSIYINKDIQV